jgi:4-amino-4-deoxy-L-arabinose transferase-like glycosyltransferase
MVSPGTKLRGLVTSLDETARSWTRDTVLHPTVLLLPLLAVLVVVALTFPDRNDDEAGYLELARNLTHGGYATGRPDALLDADPAYPDLWFGPGLPLVLALPVALGVPLEVLRLSGPLFLFLAVLVFFWLARRFMSTNAALAAAWALGLYIPFYTVLPNLHSEPLAVLCVVSAMYAMARVCEDGGARWVALGGVALAGLALTRVAYGWVLTIALVGALGWWAMSRARSARRLAAMYVLGLALCVPWLVYTAAETGRLLQWGNSGALSLYWMTSPRNGDLGDWQQASAVFTDPNLAAHRPFFRSLEGRSLPDQNSEIERRAFRNIRDHPGKYVENIAANVSRILFDAPYSYSKQRLGALYVALPNALLLGALLVAAILATRISGLLPPPATPFAIFAAPAFAVHALVAAYPRMLFPIVPVLFWLAATAIATTVRRAKPNVHDRA